jgi:hypothetical protein
MLGTRHMPLGDHARKVITFCRLFMTRRNRRNKAAETLCLACLSTVHGTGGKANYFADSSVVTLDVGHRWPYI